ncbi:MAG: hypothetical protein LQ352_004814 [Teloschistes flavicans]|nr:MAG: hypothetical protein LQ352_004814 [Teloschistes flavicans]
MEPIKFAWYLLQMLLMFTVKATIMYPHGVMTWVAGRLSDTQNCLLAAALYVTIELYMILLSFIDMLDLLQGENLLKSIIWYILHYIAVFFFGYGLYQWGSSAGRHRKKYEIDYESVSKDLRGTKKQLAKVKNENLEYKRRLQSCFNGQDDFVADSVKMHEETKIATKEMEEFRTEYHKALGREGELTRKLEEMEAMLGQVENHEQANDQLQIEVQRLRTENGRLRTRQHAPSEPSRPVKLPQILQDSRHDVNGVPAATVGLLEQPRLVPSALRNLRRVNDTLEQKVEDLENSCKGYQIQLDQAKKDKKSADEDRDKANKELLISNARREKVESESRDAVAARDVAKKASDQELSEANDTLAENGNLLTKNKEELSQATKTISEQTETIRLLKEKVNEETESRGRLQNAQSEIERLNRELSKSQDEQKTAYVQMRANLAKEWEIAQAEIAREHERECQKVEEEATTRAVKDCQAQFEDYKKNADADRKDSDPQSLYYKEEQKRVQNLFNELISDLGLAPGTSFHGFREYLFKLVREMEETKTCLESEQRRVEQLQQAQNNASPEIFGWTQKVKMEEEYNKLQQGYREIYEHRQELRSKNTQLAMSKKNLMDMVTTLQREKDSVGRSNDSHREKNGKLTMERDDLQGQIEKSKKEINGLGEVVRGLQGQIKESQTEKKGLEEAVLGLQGQIEESQTEKQGLEEAVKELETTGTKLSNDI